MRYLLPVLLLACPLAAQDAVLPPLPPWQGKSLSLAVPPSHEWATPFEKSGLKATPRYDETVAWLRRLVAAAPELSMVSLGRSDEGRDVWMVIASADRAFTPARLRATGKPILLAQGGIHSGEIDGKDAGMMLLRDMTVRGTKRGLLDGAALLFIPILSVDGHERFGKFSRVNQRGPVAMGWRTNSRNLNLNRDYAKLDTPELRALVGALNTWQPDLYLDIHVTDGADYQYDVTWGYNGTHAHSPALSTWMRDHMDPALNANLRAMGHIPGPLVFAVDGADMTKGNVAPTFGPRYSNGYGDVRHLATVLVENHSLKPFRQRVLGTHVLLESAMRLLAQKGAALRTATQADRARRRTEVPLAWKRGEPVDVEFLGIDQGVVKTDVTGGDRVVWKGRPVTLTIPLLQSNVPDRVVARPKAYWIPPAWREVIERLEVHGIEMERLAAPRAVAVEMYRVKEFKLATAPFEGHVPVTAEFTKEQRRETFPAGSVRIPTDQPLGDLAMLLLEPACADSFFRWGFFLEILQRTEYVENYAMVPLAELMLKRNAKLKAAYDQKVKDDETFAKDPRARLRWLYEKTPYFDARFRLYPVARER